MKLSPIVLRLREADIDPFGINIAGAAELGSIQKDTLLESTAYVVQLTEVAIPNDIEGDVSQRLIESFGVIVALRNDLTQKDKTGLTAYDSLFEIRKGLFNTLVGWFFPDLDENDGYYQEGPIYYKGGVLQDINPAWMWYQFEFEYNARVNRTMEELATDDFNTIYAQYVITPNAQIPIKSAKPLPDVIDDSDMEQVINLTKNLLAGSFDRGFASGFDLYKGT